MRALTILAATTLLLVGMSCEQLDPGHISAGTKDLAAEMAKWGINCTLCDLLNSTWTLMNMSYDDLCNLDTVDCTICRDACDDAKNSALTHHIVITRKLKGRKYGSKSREPQGH